MKALRRERRMTQEQLAEAIGRTVDTMSNIERGAASTKMATLVALAGVFDLTLAELFELPSPTPKDRNKQTQALRLQEIQALAARLDAARLEQALALLRTMAGQGATGVAAAAPAKSSRRR